MKRAVGSRSFGSAHALRAMIAGQRAAARASAGVAVRWTPDEAFRAALDIGSLYPERTSDPVDAVREREVEQARAAWVRLKARFAR